MSLDDIADPPIQAIATLVKGAVNAKLSAQLGEDAICTQFGGPLPLGLLPHQTLPAITVWRFQDRDISKSDWDFLSRTTFRIDYYAPSTPLDRMSSRWAILAAVWECIAGTLKVGCDPNVAEGARILEQNGIGQLFNGSPRVRYAFVPGGESGYPGFQGSFDFQTCYDPGEGLIVDSNLDTLDAFVTAHTEWDLRPDVSVVPVVEAEQDIELEQP